MLRQAGRCGVDKRQHPLSSRSWRSSTGTAAPVTAVAAAITAQCTVHTGQGVGIHQALRARYLLED